VAAASYDKGDVLKAFAEEKRISFPLLSDKDSQTIREFGILNEETKDDPTVGGIPHPGMFLIDENGIIREKYFKRDYRQRYLASEILTAGISADDKPDTSTIENEHLKIVSSADRSVDGDANRIRLNLDIEIKPKVHVYAPGVKGGYIPIEWKIEEVEGIAMKVPEYPAPKSIHLAVIDETVLVYEGKIRISRLISVSEDLAAGGDKLEIPGTFRYQACDDKICYLPKTLSLRWILP